jgi:hypothetical protein
MNLESLKSEKFEAFNGTELSNIMKVIGGTPIAGGGTYDLIAKSNDYKDDNSNLDGPGYDVYCSGRIRINQEHISQNMVRFTGRDYVGEL